MCLGSSFILDVAGEAGRPPGSPSPPAATAQHLHQFPRWLQDMSADGSLSLSVTAIDAARSRALTRICLAESIGFELMAVLKRQFFSHERGLGDEDFYYLARNAETGKVFVFHEWSHKRGNGFEPGATHIELDAFLVHRGTAQDKLRALIGTLVLDSSHA
jgi:hypothetical protein